VEIESADAAQIRCDVFLVEHRPIEPKRLAKERERGVATADRLVDVREAGELSGLPGLIGVRVIELGGTAASRDRRIRAPTPKIDVRQPAERIGLRIPLITGEQSAEVDLG